MESFEQGTPETENTLIVRPSAAGGADELIQALTRVRVRLVRNATQLIRRLRIDEADMDGEGAVDLALFELWQTEAHRDYQARWGEDTFFKRAWGTVRRVILQQKKRARSFKRGGGGRAGNPRSPGSALGAKSIGAGRHGFRRVEADLDQFVSRESPVEPVVDARLDLEALLGVLDDDVLRTVLTMHHEGAHVTEIANVLDLHRKTVARKMKEIAGIYRKPKYRP